MSFDREHVLRQAAQVQPRRRPGVAGLLSGIHRSDELRGWITMESVALPPVPERTADGWTLWSLIGVGKATPGRRELPIHPVWGAVRWAWPSEDVLRHVKLSELPEVAASVEATISDPSAWTLSMQPDALAERARFFQSLGRFLADPEADARGGPKILAGLYARVMPVGAVAAYHRLVPSTASWLRAGAPREAAARRDSGDSPTGRPGPSGQTADRRQAPAPGPRPAGDDASGTPGPNQGWAGRLAGGPGAGGAGAPGAAGPDAGSAHAGGAEHSAPAVVTPAAPRPPAPRPAAEAPAAPVSASPPAPAATPPGSVTSLVRQAPSATTLGRRINDAHTIATDFGLDAIAAELDRLRARMRRPGLRIAVVGEFGRGKTSLINRLLGAPVLPEGRHTPVPLVVVAGPEPRLELQFADGRAEPRPAVAAAWDEVYRLSEDRDLDAPRLVGVRVLVAEPELARLDVELVDTPGVNAGRGKGEDAEDLDRRTEDLVRRTVAASDAVLMVVSASAPLGLSETAFLEEEVIARHVPRITVVVSKLDTVDEDEREDIVDYLGGRVRRISPTLRVLAGPHREDASPAAGVYERITEYSTSGGRRSMRSRQTAGQLLALLDEMAGLGRDGLAGAALGEAERRRAVEESEVEIDRMAGEWGRVRVELQQRRTQTSEKFREHLQLSRGDLLDTLRYELERAPDARTWWERDLPFRLRRELTALAKKFEAQLHSSVQADVQWLDAKMKLHFGRGSGYRLEKVEQLSTEFELGEAESLGLKDLKSRKLAWRIGPTGVAVLGALLIPLTGGVSALPMGASMAASAGGMVLGEVKSTSLTEAQRAQAMKALEPVVEEVLGGFSEEVSKRLHTLYAGVMDEAVRGQRAWRTDRQTALAKVGADGPAWQDLVSRSEQLGVQLNTMLGARG
ncbi:dynamin family protein [Embleya hyalina]|uniref:Bacterial dynamin-like protein n=1 Tax=Embleya hyalina TaxID=516124 RepID=A0A401YPE9_9ACTN|nr:dynamin family protein [Embleya hyalina]GCD96470.1 bacterial dynamin-like protein [Embleya hyalina]